MRRVPLVFMASVIVVALTGCGGGSPGGGEKLEQDKSPLSEYFSEIYDKEGVVGEQLKLEEAVAVCMKEQGFEYIPSVDPSVREAYDSDFESEEWVAQNGYGVFARPETDFSEETAVNPNNRYVEGLSASERTAYEEALHGSIEGGDSDSEGQGGCYRVGASEGFVPERADDFSEAYAALSEELAKNQESIRIEVDEEWASCIADAGYPEFTSPYDAAEKFYTKFAELDPDGDGLNLKTAEAQEWKKLEIETALADFKCKTEVGYEQKLLKVQFEFEEQFIKDNQALLDDIREEAQQYKEKKEKKEKKKK